VYGPRTMRPTLSSILVAGALASALVPLAACGSKSAGGSPPAQPANGAPIAFEVTKFTPGADRDGKVEVKGYNFSDKSIGAYVIVVRYTDKAGAPLKVGVGTPFEKDVAWTSMSGRKYACEPKSWCTVEVSMIEVPAATAKAEAAITRAESAGEEKPVWESSKGMTDWPL
jgi:hypothetical protein